MELKVTKTNTELTAHATKCGLTLEVAFPGATALAAELIAKSAGGKKGKDKGNAPAGGGKKGKASAADLDDLFSAGLSVSDKKKKGKK